MKAYSYLQLSVMQHNDQLPDDYMDTMERIAVNKTPDEFYSQEFKPELITELFEGWELSEDGVYYNGDIFIDYDCNGDGLNICYSGVSIVPMPRTLDDFITDCQRAGIELEWKR